MHPCFQAVVFVLLIGVGVAHAAGCPPDTISRQEWDALKACEFAVADQARRQTIALALLPCLDDPDPTIRDGLAIEALTSWLRNKQIQSSTAKQLLTRLVVRLKAPDETGFGRPFAALALAEVARMDRIEAYLTDAEFAALVTAATEYLKGVRDYRGFDEREGWRHGVAHGADVLMQLALNPRATKPQLDAMLEAIASQIAPPGHFYIYGESGRLARPVLFIAQRNVHSTEDWGAWLKKSAVPADFSTQSALAKRHNTIAFLTVLHVLVHQSEDGEWRQRLLEPLTQALSG